MQKSSDMLFTPPKQLLAGRLIFDLDPSPGLSKTVKNFTTLCTGEKGMCKSARNKKLHYLDCPIHRIVRGFVAQGGDITRGDGSGGEVRLSARTCGRLDPIVCTSPVHLRRQVQRRQGRIQKKVQEGVFGDGELGKEHELVSVLRRSHRR